MAEDEGTENVAETAVTEGSMGMVGTAVTEEKGSWIPAVLKQPLSRIQAIVGLAAGLLSVGGVVFPLVGFAMFPTHGDFVAVVHEAGTRRPILDAAVQIDTSENAVVTTLVSLDSGRVRHKLKEGQYRVRVNHPKFTPEVRRVQVIAGQTSEVYLVLAPRPVPPPPVKPVEKSGAVSGFFRSLGL